MATRSTSGRCTRTRAARSGSRAPIRREHPALRFNYLSTDQDRREWVEAIHVARNILGQPAFEPFNDGEISPGPSVATDAEILEWVARDAETALHPSCTARMGTDERSVTDPRTMEVRGTSGLRVVDASVFPYIPNGNIYAPVMMVAEKAADLIIGNQPLAPEQLPFYRHRGAGMSPRHVSQDRHPAPDVPVGRPGVPRLRLRGARGVAEADDRRPPGPHPGALPDCRRARAGGPGTAWRRADGLVRVPLWDRCARAAGDAGHRLGRAGPGVGDPRRGAPFRRPERGPRGHRRAATPSRSSAAPSRSSRTRRTRRSARTSRRCGSSSSRRAGSSRPSASTGWTAGGANSRTASSPTTPNPASIGFALWRSIRADPFVTGVLP